MGVCLVWGALARAQPPASEWQYDAENAREILGIKGFEDRVAALKSYPPPAQ